MIRNRQLQVSNPASGASAKPGEEAVAPIQLTMLRAFLLPPACRDVFVLRDIQGYTLPEVAAVLGISRKVVNRHLRRARREMQTS